VSDPRAGGGKGSISRPGAVDSAVEFTEDGIVDESGTETKVDVIICATGFDVTRPSYDIIGQGDRNLGEEWVEFPKGYLSIIADGFPNMFCEQTYFELMIFPLY
jgi:cation diffusion facilitator CzcD-associated flavoprotein CzcO